MKIVYLFKRRLFVILLLLEWIIPSSGLASLNGITGRTMKSRTTGCGSCHGSSATSSVIVSITGPDTVTLNQSASFTLTISGGPASGAGCNIATRYGTLGVVSSTLKLSNGELTHITNTAMTGGSISFQFNYIYNGIQRIDTIFANGLSTNSNGSSSGDQWNWAVGKRLVVATPTAVENEWQSPREFGLVQNFPNPFNPATTIRYSIPKSTQVILKVYDAGGREIATLVDESQQPGAHQVKWNSEGLPSGIYFYRILAGNYADTKKMILLK